ncbi:MAG: hypothetical protein ACSNEK_02230 [Parachlamydiaceae bacterium]
MADMKYERNIEGAKLKELLKRFDPKLHLEQQTDLTYCRLVQVIQSLQRLLDQFVEDWRSKISRLEGGFSDEELVGIKRSSNGYQTDKLLVRCFDEEMKHLNHPFHQARLTTPRDLFRGLHLYRYPFNEYLAYELALALKFNDVMPKTSLCILESDQFFSILEEAPTKRTKLCSVQSIINGGLDPFDFTLSFFKERQAKHVALKEILSEYHALIDVVSFEKVFILSWLMGEMNGSARKYQFVQKNGKLQWLKTSCLTSFSSNYFETDSFLTAYPQITRPLSEEAKTGLLDFEEAPFVEKMIGLGKSEGAISCFKDHLRRMKEVAERPASRLADFVPVGWRKDHWKMESFLIKLRNEGIAFTN